MGRSCRIASRFPVTLRKACPPPAKVEVTYVPPGMSEGVVEHLGISQRARDLIVRVDFQVLLIVDVLKELLGCPLVQRRGIDEFAGGTAGVINGCTGEREVFAFGFFAAFVEVDHVKQRGLRGA